MASMSTSLDAVTGGFADPVFDGQSVFRALMDAMARPGTVRTVTPAVSAPAPFNRTAAAILLSLCDGDTPVWLDPALAKSESARAWIAFHAGSPLTAEPSEAGFAVLSDAVSLIAFDRFATGTQEYPDRSTTVILQVEALDGGPALELEGPGIEGTTRIAPTGLPAGFAAMRAANRALFPRGTDCVLAGPDALVGLPRTTRIKALED